VTINFRFAPDRTPQAALAHVREVFTGLEVEIEQTDVAAGALPGLHHPAAAALVDAADVWFGPSSAGLTWRVSRPWGYRR